MKAHTKKANNHKKNGPILGPRVVFYHRRCVLYVCECGHRFFFSSFLLFYSYFLFLAIVHTDCCVRTRPRIYGALTEASNLRHFAVNHRWPSGIRIATMWVNLLQALSSVSAVAVAAALFLLYVFLCSVRPTIFFTAHFFFFSALVFDHAWHCLLRSQISYNIYDVAFITLLNFWCISLLASIFAEYNMKSLLRAILACCLRKPINIHSMYGDGMER